VIDADIRDVTSALAGGGYEIYVSRHAGVKRKVTKRRAEPNPICNPTMWDYEAWIYGVRLVPSAVGMT
jgi:hypothetical protein